MGYEKKYKVTIEADDEIIFIANVKEERVREKLILREQPQIWMRL